MKSYKIRCCLELFSGLTSSLELFLGLTSFTRVSCCLELFLKGYIGFLFCFFNGMDSFFCFVVIEKTKLRNLH